MTLFATVLLASVLSGCASNDACTAVNHAQANPCSAVYVVKRALAHRRRRGRCRWPNRDWSMLADFPNSRYLEFGWGR